MGFTVPLHLRDDYVPGTNTPYRGTQIERVHRTLNTFVRNVCNALGSGVLLKPNANSFRVTAGVGFLIDIAEGNAILPYGNFLAPVHYPATSISLENYPNRDASDPIYIFLKVNEGALDDEGTPRGDVYETGEPIFQVEDLPSLPNALPIAAVTTSGTGILTVTDLRPTIALGDMLKALYDTNNSGVVDDAEKLGGQTLAQVRERANHSGTQTASTISDFTSVVQALIVGATLNQLLAPTDALSMGGQRLTNLGAPSSSNDGARKADVDAARQGFSIKDPVVATTTESISLSGTQTIDGVALAEGDRVLVKDQTDGTQNGIYVVAAGAWARSDDANADSEVKSGLAVWVTRGTTNGQARYVLNTLDPIVVGTTSLHFVHDSSTGGVSSVNFLTGAVVLDGDNVFGRDPTNDYFVTSLNGIFDALYAAIEDRALEGLLTDSGLTLSANSKLLGRSTAGGGAAEEIGLGTGLQMASGTLSGVPFSGSGSGHAAGLVPDPGSAAGTTRFLREDGSWSAPPASTSADGTGELVLDVSAGVDIALTDAQAANGTIRFTGTLNTIINVTVNATVRRLWYVLGEFTGTGSILFKPVGGTGSLISSGIGTVLISTAVTVQNPSFSLDAISIRTKPVSTTAPTNGQTLQYNSTSGQLEWVTPSTGFDPRDAWLFS